MDDKHIYKKAKESKREIPDDPVEVKNVLREVVCNMLGVKPDCSDEELLKVSKGENNGKTDHSKG